MTGTGSYTLNANYLEVSTGPTSGGLARVWKAPSLSPLMPTWAKNRTIQFKAEIRMFADAASENYVSTGVGLPASDGFGFKFTDTKIRGFASNGGAVTLVDLITGLTPGTYYNYKFKAVFTAGIKVEFYIDGVLLGTITTNLPVTDTNAYIPCWFAVKSGADALSLIRTSGFTIQQDL
jgi:hypothetical protein